jgi:hypothetical protein
MALSARERIDRWVGELLATAPQGDGVSIVLVHAAVDQTQRTVKTWRLEESVANLEALVTEVDEIAEGDAEGLGGRQRYVLRAQVRGKDVGSLTIRYELRHEGGGPAVDSEPATTAGTIAVLQRHAEGAMRMMVQSFGGVIESYKEQVNAQKALIADFQKQAADNFRLQEELASRKLEQELLLQERQTQLQLTAARETSELQKSQMIWVQGLNKLYELAPVVLHYLTKGESGTPPEELLSAKRAQHEEQIFANADDATIAAWKRALQPQEFDKVMQGLAQYRAAHADASVTAAATSIEDRKVAEHAARLYDALATRLEYLGPVATALMAGQTYESLAAPERQLLDEVTVDADLGDGRSLWTVLQGQDLNSLLPVVGSLNARTPWSALPPGQKLALMAVATQVGQLG